MPDQMTKFYEEIVHYTGVIEDAHHSAINWLQQSVTPGQFINRDRLEQALSAEAVVELCWHAKRAAEVAMNVGYDPIPEVAKLVARTRERLDHTRMANMSTSTLANAVTAIQHDRSRLWVEHMTRMLEKYGL